MKRSAALRALLEWMLALSVLAACAGAGAPPGAAGPASGDLSLASPQGPAVQGNAADKYEGGFPAPIADLESCGFTYCLFEPKSAAQCRKENGAFRILFSGSVVPGGTASWQNLSGRAVRIVDPALNRFVDAALSGEISQENNVLKNRSGSFEVALNGSLPLKREVYLLPADEAAKPFGEEFPCETGLCPSPQSELVAWGGSDLTLKLKPSNEVEKSTLTQLHSGSSDLEIRDLSSVTHPLRNFPDCPAEGD
ncbi:MAG: hypothetical protein IT572_09555 [Deltaproteobacteria bacterium]|nr:hypothetical protein [Deltaproteobacteria bacterium]